MSIVDSHPSSPSRPIPAAAEKPAGLLRQLGVFSAAALVVSNMVGTGIFTSTGFLAGDLGSVPLVFLVWVVGAVFALVGAFCYSELGVNYPASGGEYVYLTRAYGPTWGFMTGWISFFGGFSAPIATTALAFSGYLGHFFPALKAENAPITLLGGALRIGWGQVAAASLIAVFTVLNFFGVGRVARIQNVLTSAKLLVLLALIGFGFILGTGSSEHFSMKVMRTTTTPVALQFAVSFFWIYVAYSGWNAATYVAEELKRPERTLPLALTVGAVIVAALYLGLNAVFLYGAPLSCMVGQLAVGKVAAEHLFGAFGASIFTALFAVSLMSTVNAMVTIGPRVYYAMAKNGAFFAAAAKVNPRWHTPVNAIVAQGICAVLMTMTPFTELVFYVGLLLNFCAVMSVGSLFIFRRRPGWQKLGVVSFAWPLLPTLFVIVGLWMTVFGVTLKPAVSGVAVLTIAVGAAVYRWRVHGRAAV